MSAGLDPIDLKMLRLLQKNGRLSNAELAQTVDVSPATCHRRTQRLFADGHIKGVRALVAPEKVQPGRPGHGGRGAGPLHPGQLRPVRGLGGEPAASSWTATWWPAISTIS